MANEYHTGPIRVEGCAVNDFLLTNHLPPNEAPAVIERDRLLMSARPGFNRKFAKGKGNTLSFKILIVASETLLQKNRSIPSSILPGFSQAV